ncbi:retroviral-like aspartic protease family protein [Sphingoaurantiacus capsulatus]|uniref:Retroviral-like aspartic protease family protein n=1 Tax=Sphingoaurantiacus capsulatus TaxID=1771310 RepID=A0ABV7XBT4_9SPHN
MGRFWGGAALLAAMLATTTARAEVPQAPVGDLTATNESVLATAQDKLTRMTVPVFVNGQGPFAFAVDTGADRTVISQSLATKLGLIADRAAQLHGVAGVDVVRTTRLEKLKIGHKEVADIRAPILPDAALGAAGLIGIDALADQRVTMDFIGEQMTVRPSDYRVPEDKDADVITITAKRRFGQLVLVNASVNGQRVYAIVDSGSQVTIGNPELRKMMVRGAKGTEVSTELVSVTGRKIAADYGMLPRMKIGGVILGDIPIVYSDAHPFKKFKLAGKPAMLIGVDILRAFERVSLDFDTKKVRFQLRSEKAAF